MQSRMQKGESGLKNKVTSVDDGNQEISKFVRMVPLLQNLGPSLVPLLSKTGPLFGPSEGLFGGGTRVVITADILNRLDSPKLTY